MTAFEEWWFEYGSGMRPEPEEDYEEFAKRIAEASWNKAIDAAASSAKAKIVSVQEKSGDWTQRSVVIKNSILKLKK